MSALGSIAERLLDRAESILGPRLRAYAPLPGGLAQLVAILGTTVVAPPCVYCAWRGSERQTRDGGLRVTSAWSLLAVTQAAAGEIARRKGDAARGTIGGEEIAERLAVALDGFTLPGYGTATVRRLGPLDLAPLLEMAVAVTEVRVELPHDLADEDPSAGLDDFLTFAADYDLAPTDGAIEAADTMTLPREG